MRPDLLFVVLFLFLFQHGSQNCVTRSLVHSQHTVSYDCFDCALRQIIYEAPVVIIGILILDCLVRVLLYRRPFLFVCQFLKLRRIVLFESSEELLC